MLIESPAETDIGALGRIESLLRMSTVSGVVTINSSGTITTLTTDADNILHLSRKKKPLTIESLPIPLQRLIREARESRQTITDQQIAFASGKSTITARVTVTHSVLDSTGHVVVLLKADTAKAQMEQNLRRLDRLANVGMLSASMAHEIKNALVAVRTFTELLLEKHPDAELAGVVRREVGRVDSIATQLMRFAVPAQPKYSAIRVHKLLEHSIRLTQHGCRNKRITFCNDFKAESDALTGDDYQLEQAFVNLFFNAVESIADEGSLTVSTELVQDESSCELRESAEQPRLFQIKITDTGAGIPPNDIESIFQPFFTTKQSGTGLGLAVTHRIIKEHHGSIRVESVPGKGTTFTLLLPADASR